MGYIRAFAFALAAMHGLAHAQELDSATVNVTGFVADVCRVEALTGVSASGVTADLGGVATGAGVKTASLRYQFDIANDANPSAADIGDIADGRIDVDLDLYCNGPFQFTIAATNGAMVNEDPLVNAAGFTNTLDYTVDFAFPDGAAAPTTASGGAGGQLVFIPNAPPQNGAARLSISFANPTDGRNLISGVYGEALRISFVQDGLSPPSTFP